MGDGAKIIGAMGIAAVAGTGVHALSTVSHIYNLNTVSHVAQIAHGAAEVQIGKALARVAETSAGHAGASLGDLHSSFSWADTSRGAISVDDMGRQATQIQAALPPRPSHVWISVDEASRHNAADAISVRFAQSSPDLVNELQIAHSSDVEAIVKKYVDNAVRTYAQASHDSWVSLELNGTAKIEKSLRIGRISIKPGEVDLVKTGQSAVIAAMACYEYASGELKRCLDKAVDRIRLALFDWRTPDSD